MAHDAADNREPAGDDSPLSHIPRRHAALSAYIRSSTSHDRASSDGTLSCRPTYEDDPPWEEVRNFDSEPEPSQVIPGRLPTSNDVSANRPPGMPHPSTPRDLYENLVRTITSNRRVDLSTLFEYHAAFPTLHSTASFNILIRCAIRHASFGTVSQLLHRMVQEGVSGNEETRALRVRGLVRSGRWGQAWREELELMRGGGQGLPLSVWLELLGSVKRGAIMDNSYVRPRGQASRLQTPDPSVVTGRLHALMDHPPLPVSADSGEPHPVQVVHAVVRALLVAEQRREAAIEITKRYFKTLPRELDEEWRGACLGIIDLHMALGRTRKLSEHFAALKTLFAFLEMHDAFRPTSATLFLLLQTLAPAKDCGRRADRLVRSFENRWGTDIIDLKVCRRWASLWLKQGNPQRADAVLHAHDHLLTAHTQSMAGEEPDSLRQSHWLDVHRTSRPSRERWLWRLVRRRIWGEKVRRSGQAPSRDFLSNGRGNVQLDGQSRT
uniref:Rho-GAP domain-containing protein n=1 Tax=Ganoderma boninense TaxID=34458 RepID=A0A5K1JRF1_9APHY|nr:Rho-GAP domain-containing protein [Ganoderma boninense]